MILTVSPVPLVATAEGGHVLSATTYSKSVLRAAAEQGVRGAERENYFPAYEIITRPQAPKGYVEDDRSAVSPSGIDAVMSTFFGQLKPGDVVKSKSEPSVAEAIHARSRQVVAAECEEAFADVTSSRT